MIKATELRIGNLIQHETDGEPQIVAIDAIGKDSSGYNGYFIKYKGGSCTLEDLGELDFLVKPIAITEEWLIKSRFSTTISNKDSGYKQYGLNIKGLDLMFCIECNSSPEFYLCMVGVDIQYIHQLQNLYFALTGEELTIQP